MNDWDNRLPLNLGEALTATSQLASGLSNLKGVIQFYQFANKSEADSNLITSNEILEANAHADVSVDFVIYNSLALPKGQPATTFLAKAIKNTKKNGHEYLLQIKIIKEQGENSVLFSAYSEIVIDTMNKVYLFGYEKGGELSSVLKLLIAEHRRLEKKFLAINVKPKNKDMMPKQTPKAIKKNLKELKAKDSKMRLQELKELFKSGLITETVYEKKQQAILEDL